MDHEKPPRRPTTVKFARKTSSGRYVSLSREDIDNMINYMVQMPPTPDNQSTIDEEEEASVGSSGPLFGGIPRPDQRVNKMVHESEIGNSQMAESRSSMCSMPECERAIVQDGGGFDNHPCECSFNICRNCYLNVQKEGGTCPSCKEPYKIESYDTNRNPIMSTIPQQEDWMASKRIPVMKRSETVDSDQSWLYEMQGTYDYSSAFWSKDGTYNADSIIEEELQEGIERRSEKSWKPLTRKIPMSAAIISPYRLLVLIRLVALTLFLAWRVKHPNEDAIWLWAMSVVCEIWFAFSWILDQVPKLSPVNRSTDLSVLQEKFEAPNTLSDLPGVDVFVSTADPEKEPPLVTANTILSILAADYPVEKLACYISDDGGALLTFEAMAEAASFASMWVPFCRKHEIEPRNPDSYFGLKRDPTKNKMRSDFVRDRRKVKREYDEFKVRVNGLTDSIRRRSDAYNAREEMKVLRKMRESGGELEVIKASKATWMADGTYWPGTWVVPGPDHSRGDHASILQVMVEPPAACSPVLGMKDEESGTDLTGVDIRLPMLVYVSREKRPGYDHNKKAGAMNALVRVSAVLSNGPFILNLDCDHYIYNTQAIREGMCFMMDRGGETICYIQFPQRFEGIDPSDRYANHNTIFFDGNMRALDGVQGPMYVGTGCIFRRFALYGFDPPMEMTYEMTDAQSESEIEALKSDSFSSDIDMSLMPKRFGNSVALVESIPIAEFQGRPLADHPGVNHGRPPGALRAPRPLLDPGTVAEAVSVISCWYEDKTEWGDRVGWIYGSVTEDVVTGYRMHNRGWHSVYCITKRDAFRGTAPINLTDRLHQVLRWATGSVEIFFSRNNALIATSKMKFLQRIAYLNVGIYPFTSFFLLVYCFLPALSLFSGQFIVRTLNVTFLIYLLTITITLTLLAILEVKWSGVGLEEWWRNEQFWLISGTSAHLYAVVQGLLKVIAGIEISFTLTSKSAASENDDVDIYADLYVVKWTSLMVPPITIMMVNLIAVAVGFARTIYSTVPEWSKLLGGGFFSFWVLVHLYPFAKGLMGKRGQTPTIVFVWSGLIAITISLLWVAINPPNNKYQGALLSSGGL